MAGDNEKILLNIPEILERQVPASILHGRKIPGFNGVFVDAGTYFANAEDEELEKRGPIYSGGSCGMPVSPNITNDDPDKIGVNLTDAEVVSIIK